MAEQHRSTHFRQVAFWLFFRASGALLLAFLGTRSMVAEELPPLTGRVNLALGRPVVFSPEPNYRLTAQGNSDTIDLTDGSITRRADRKIWFDSSAVGWSYGGRVARSRRTHVSTPTTWN